MYSMHSAKLWADKTKTKSLILESLSHGNQKPTGDWRAGRGPGLEGWGGLQFRSLGGFIVSFVALGVSKRLNTPLTKYKKHIPGPNENDLWIIDPIWLFMPPRPSFGPDS